MTDTDYSDAASTFGDRLAAARQGAGVRRKDLARQIGVKSSTLRNWEDDRSAPRSSRLNVLAGVLGVSLIWLMTGEGAGPRGADDWDEDAGDQDDAEAGAARQDARAAKVTAVLADLSSTRAELTAVNRRLAGLERRLSGLVRQ